LGYPQLGGGDFHIAHMLWGGLIMGISLILALTYKGKSVDQTVAILGGIGFGVFIDELGKFVTSNNDYFFKPTVALIYLLFILFFFFVRLIVTDDSWLVRLFSRGYQKAINSIFLFKDWMEAVLLRVTSLDITRSLALILVVLMPVVGIIHWRFLLENQVNLSSFVFLGGVIGTLVELLSAILGVIAGGKQRERLFRYSIVWSILFTQFFLFYASELLGIYKLIISLCLLLVFRKK
jgi:hypothetical protein